MQIEAVKRDTARRKEVVRENVSRQECERLILCVCACGCVCEREMDARAHVNVFIIDLEAGI